MSRIGPVQFRINHLLFWLTPLVCICVFAVPPIVAVKLLRALKARFP
jgi:hypothetical protein